MKTRQQAQAANAKGRSPFASHPMYAAKQPTKRVKAFLLRHTSKKHPPGVIQSSESEDDDATVKTSNKAARKRCIFSESSDSSDPPTAEPPKKKSKPSISTSTTNPTRNTIKNFLNGKQKKITVTGPGEQLLPWYHPGYYMILYMCISSISVELPASRRGKVPRPKRIEIFFCLDYVLFCAI